jgi:hypothetical protein
MTNYGNMLSEKIQIVQKWAQEADFQEIEHLVCKHNYDSDKVRNKKMCWLLFIVLL